MRLHPVKVHLMQGLWRRLGDANIHARCFVSVRIRCLGPLCMVDLDNCLRVKMQAWFRCTTALVQVWDTQLPVTMECGAAVDRHRGSGRGGASSV
eukprot:1251252-Rhodomonas_salina.2